MVTGRDGVDVVVDRGGDGKRVVRKKLFAVFEVGAVAGRIRVGRVVAASKIAKRIITYNGMNMNM